LLVFVLDPPSANVKAEVIIVGGGIAGLSAAIYLARAHRDTLVIDNGQSMARWEPDVQNYLGFPEGIHGLELLRRAKRQAARYGVNFAKDEIVSARGVEPRFTLRGEKSYSCRRLLLATGIVHIPPDIPGVKPCLGHSMFFCKDCDGYRVRKKSVSVYGWTNEAVQYALAMRAYSNRVFIVSDGRKPRWNRQHKTWVREYGIPVYTTEIINTIRRNCHLRAIELKGGRRIATQALFTTRGDIYFNKLARGLGAKLDRQGQIKVDNEMRTSIRGLYAAGCVTPANCQMIIAAGEGAMAAQAINKSLFKESLATHSLTCPGPKERAVR
jgi:thioredoxin reductase (NADPH)